MKSRIDYEKNNEIILSIGLIVKNEENVLERCLESLQPIIKSVKSELIIVDTGSEDRTVEIAKKYTNNIYYFEWINDFSAARNFTLEKAKGRWYLYIDADEYFDSEGIQILIKFFAMPEYCDCYNTIEYTIRSYYNDKKTEYSDTCVPRLYRILENKTWFSGKIHEAIEIEQPCGILPITVHHTGYCYNTEEDLAKKHERNYILLEKEYNDNPSDQRTMMHMLDLVNTYPEKRDYYINAAYNMLKKNSKEYFSSLIYMQLADIYLSESPKKTLQICNDYFLKRKDFKNFLVSVPMYSYKADGELALKDYESAFKSYCEYIENIKKYKLDELDTSEQSAHPVYRINNRDYNVVLTIASEKFFNAGFKGKSVYLLENTNVSGLCGADLRYYLKILLNIYSSSNKDELKKLEKIVADCPVQDEEKYSSEYLYLLLKSKSSLFESVLKIGVIDFNEKIKRISDEYIDFCETVYNYGVPDECFSNIKYFSCIVNIYLAASLNASSLDYEKRQIIYSKFIDLLILYINNIYNPEILNEDDIEVLPALHIFGFFMTKAYELLSKGDKAGYIKKLKKALISCESMNDVVRFMLEQFRKNN